MKRKTPKARRNPSKTNEMAEMWPERAKTGLFPWNLCDYMMMMMTARSLKSKQYDIQTLKTGDKRT